MVTTMARIVGHWHKHFSEIFWCSAMYVPVGDDTDFEVHSLFNRCFEYKSLITELLETVNRNVVI